MNTLWLILALLSPSVTGWFLIGAVAGTNVRAGWTGAVRLVAGTGIGWAIAAGVYFLWRVSNAEIGIAYRLVDCVVVPGAVALVHARRQTRGTAPSPRVQGRSSWWMMSLALVTLVVCAGAVAAAVQMAHAEPIGSWDANAIWNLKARFMYRGGDGWTRMFAKEIWFSHPDYPLMLPASAARLWTYVGYETPAGPIGVGVGFTILTMALLFAGVGWLCGIVPACVAVMLLAGNEVFIWYGGAQVADVPLSFFVLAAIVFLTVAWQRVREGGETPPLRVMMAAGACAGLGAFVKNEGLAICVMLVVACAAAAVIFRRWKPLAAVLVGLVIGLTLVATQKLLFTGETYLTADQPSTAAAVEKVLDPERHRTILTFLGRWYFGLREWYSPVEGWRLNPWPVRMLNEPTFLLLLALPLFFGVRVSSDRRPAAVTVGLLLVLVVLTYYAVLLVMPYDLAVLVQSLPRYFLHIVPTAIFSVCYVTLWERRPDAAASTVAEATTGSPQ